MARIWTLKLWLLLGLANALWAQEASEGAAALEKGASLVDRIVAVVDDDPIFQSDLRRAVGLGLVDRSGENLDRRVLDLLIDQKLRSHEADRHQSRPVTGAEVEAQLGGLAGRFGGESVLLEEAAAVGLDRSGLRRWIRHQLKVLRYVEDRLAARIFVDEEEIVRYYETEFCPEQSSSGCPPIVEARNEIEALLRGIALNREIATWTEELRAKAGIVDLLDRRERKLPPVVSREVLTRREKGQ